MLGPPGLVRNVLPMELSHRLTPFSFIPSVSEWMSIVTATSPFPQCRLGDEPEKVTLQSLIRDTVLVICLRVPAA